MTQEREQYASDYNCTNRRSCWKWKWPRQSIHNFHKYHLQVLVQTFISYLLIWRQKVCASVCGTAPRIHIRSLTDREDVNPRCLIATETIFPSFEFTEPLPIRGAHLFHFHTLNPIHLHSLWCIYPEHVPFLSLTIKPSAWGEPLLWRAWTRKSAYTGN